MAQRVKNLLAVEEIQVRSLGWQDPLEKGNGNPLQYSCLKIPWTGKSGGLQSKGLQRVRHDRAPKDTHTYTQDGCEGVYSW